jgi:hypothetical protein
MEIKTINSEQPKCKTCGKLMLEWNAWADEHEHIECISKRFSTSLIEKIRSSFIKTKITYEKKTIKNEITNK